MWCIIKVTKNLIMIKMNLRELVLPPLLLLQIPTIEHRYACHVILKPKQSMAVAQKHWMNM